jgi:chorismate mutase/prephenate dehydratase
VFTTVEQGRATYGVVPFENSLFGTVSQTLDRLRNTQLQVQAEIDFAVHHHVMAMESMVPEKIKRIYSHPEAFGQCQPYIQTHFAHVERIPVASTAKAAELASKEPGSAAICNSLCESMYGLKLIAKNVEEIQDNTTRFFIIAPASQLDATLSAYCDEKTLFLITANASNQPDFITDVLRTFKEQGVQIIRIDSRPDRARKRASQGVWQYVFFIEAAGNFEFPQLKSSVSELKKNTFLDVKVLGSYPSIGNPSLSSTLASPKN